MELPLEYVPNPQFEAFGRDKQAENDVLGPMPAHSGPAGKASAPSGLTPYVASLYEVPLLTREQEVHLFRKLNYLKYKAAGLRERLNPSRPQKSLMTRIEKLCQETVATRNQIICANLRLVVSIAKQHLGPAETFFELVSDGNMSLMRAVERFDYSMGNRFSTYATLGTSSTILPAPFRKACAIAIGFGPIMPSFSRQPPRYPATTICWRLPNPAEISRWTASCGGSTIASGRLSSAASASAAAMSRRPCSRWATSWA